MTHCGKRHQCQRERGAAGVLQRSLQQFCDCVFNSADVLTCDMRISFNGMGDYMWLTNERRVCTLEAVRFLLVNNHCISDPIAGVTQSLRTIVEWLAEAGHECHVLTTARFESPVTFTIEEHLAQQGVACRRIGWRGERRRGAKPRAAGDPAGRALRRRDRAGHVAADTAQRRNAGPTAARRRSI